MRMREQRRYPLRPPSPQPNLAVWRGRRLVDGPDLLPGLKARTQPVKTIAQEGSELEEMYSGLVDVIAGADLRVHVEEMKV